MPTVITGTDGVSQVQTGAVDSGDLPAGSVIQVVSETMNTSFSTNSTSYVNTGVVASITPTSSQSKIFVTASLNGRFVREGTSGIYELRISNNGVKVLETFFDPASGTNSSGFVAWSLPNTLAALHSPASTSLQTYVVEAKTGGGTFENVQLNRTNGECTITLMEIAG